MAYQRGSLRQVSRRNGMTWVLRYRSPKPDGRRIESIMTVGLVKDFPSEVEARKEIDRRGLLCQINADVPTGRSTLEQLAEHYLEADFGADAGRKKSDTTKAAVEHYVRNWIVPRWGGFIADEIKPLDVQRWLNSLQTNNGIACTTAAKIRGIFSRIFKIGLRYELVTRNPVEGAQTSQATDYQAIVLAPDQTLKIWRAMNHPLHQILVLTCAATGLRASEALALRWTDLLWSESRIRISKRWALGAAGPVKTKSSKGYVPMHPALAQYLADWKTQSPHSKDTDFVFPSLREGGRKPLYASSFVADYLRPAAIAAGVQIADGQRFGLHNLRHSLSNWLINQAETDPKTVQGLLRHSKIQTTLDLYTQTDRNKAQIAQGQFLEALGLTSTIQ